MALRSLLLLAVAAPAAAYEWYGVVKLAHSSEYDLTIRTLYETMRFYIAEIGATPDAAALDTIVDGAESYMQTYCIETAAHGTEIEVDTEKKCVTLTMGTGATSTYELHIGAHAHRRRLSGDDVYVAIFAEHGISEWEDSSAHFLKCGASAACGDVFPGADIELECVGDVDHSGHDHGRRLSGDNECAVVASKDNDGDGIVDLAAEGECCVSVYGSKFDNEYGCGTTLAEVQAGGCCPEDFIARYSLQPDGESQNGWDCVSFVDKDGCTEKNTQLGIAGFYKWSPDVMGPGSCPHTVEALDTLRNIQGCGTCAAEDLHDGRCGVFWLETGRWKDWAVLGMEEIGCQKDTCCASSSSACCELNVGLVAGLACGGLVFILCCVALCCFTCTGCPAYKARHKKTRSGIPKGEAPPLAPITLGGVEVDVSQEGVCSPRRVNMVYAPLATWYNTTGKGAALRAKHGPLPANPDAFNKWASMKEVTMAFLDDAGVPPAF